VPNVVAYDVSFAFELAAVIEDGLSRMFEKNENIYYYITLQNEDYPMPPMPEGAREGVLKGIYKFRSAEKKLKHHVQLFGSGSIMMQVLRAQALLADKFDVSADVWGVTSYQAAQERGHVVRAAQPLEPGSASEGAVSDADLERRARAVHRRIGLHQSDGRCGGALHPGSLRAASARTASA